MVKESSAMQMEIFMKDSFSTAEEMAKENLFIKMVLYITAVLRTIIIMEKVK